MAQLDQTQLAQIVGAVLAAHGIRALFHISQTSEIKPAKPSPKAKGKPAAAKSQLPLV